MFVDRRHAAQRVGLAAARLALPIGGDHDLRARPDVAAGLERHRHRQAGAGQVRVVDLEQAEIDRMALAQQRGCQRYGLGDGRRCVALARGVVVNGQGVTTQFRLGECYQRLWRDRWRLCGGEFEDDGKSENEQHDLPYCD